MLQIKFINLKKVTRYNYLFISKGDEKLFKIVHFSKRKEKINIGFTSKNNIFAERIEFFKITKH
jgi:hypothetical protein